jgi:dihydrofolate synthase/folylpolyglutamate synthase
MNLSSPTSSPVFASIGDAYAWLDGHVNLERSLATASYDADTFGLEPFRRRMTALGDPHRGLRTIHIAGTRGKGSAALALEALLRASGLRVATYMSPHLREYRERVRIDGESITADGFRRLLERVAAVPAVLGVPAIDDDAADVSPTGHPTGFKTVFENLTALFFLAARESGVDWAVVETGLGGRLDATNVLEPGPVLLTRIGLEHTQLLGDTRRQIAGEKAAILKPGGLAVAGAQAPPEPDGDPGAIPVFTERACQAGAPLAWASELCPILETLPSPAGQRVSLGFEGEPLALDLPLLGTFVAENLQNALAMLAVLREQGRVPRAPRERLRLALEALALPGRMERVCLDPLLIADGAHCPTGAAALADSMLAHFSHAPADLILGMMSDKDHAGFLTALAKWDGWRRVFCYPIPSNRSADPRYLAELARRHFDDARACSDLVNALQLCLGVVEKERMVVGAGTLYGVAALQDWGKNRVGERKRGGSHERVIQASPTRP